MWVLFLFRHVLDLHRYNLWSRFRRCIMFVKTKVTFIWWSAFKVLNHILIIGLPWQSSKVTWFWKLWTLLLFLRINSWIINFWTPDHFDIFFFIIDNLIKFYKVLFCTFERQISTLSWTDRIWHFARQLKGWSILR